METHDEKLEEDIKSILKEVPLPIHRLFSSGKVELVAKNLMQKYQLHIDQGAILEREIIFLLLGLKDPDEFTKSLLQEAQIQKDSVESITKDVNEQIFMPLHEEMRNGPTPTQKTPAHTANRGVSMAKPPVPQTELTQDSATLPPKSALPRQTSTPATVPAAVPPRPVSAPASTSVSIQQALPVTKPSVNRLAEWRSDTPGAPQTPLASTPTPTLTPSVPAKTVPVPRTAPPPPNLPGAPIQAPATQSPSVPIVKEYSSDPYREPIDSEI